jgi:Zn-dependent M28 family amino/carboxypeptidase
MSTAKNEIEVNLRVHVDRLAGLIGPRTLDRPKTIEATIGYVKSQWTAMGLSIREEPFDALGNEAINLIVEKTGSKRADEIVLLGAHYDTVHCTPGADDNASAVAVLLEVSRLLRHHTARRTARYVAFACEEPPYFNCDAMGSQHHARCARRRGEHILGMLCLEMVGYYQHFFLGEETFLRQSAIWRRGNCAGPFAEASSAVHGCHCSRSACRSKSTKFA